MRPFLIWAGATAFFVMVVLAGWLLLPACAVRLPFGWWSVSFCDRADMVARLDGLAIERDALLADIAALERRLALPGCTAEAAIQPAPDLPDLPAAPVDPLELPDLLPELPAPELTEDMIREGDVDALAGCWLLDSPYVVQNQETGALTEFSEWTICFEGDGKGYETMRGSDGSTCEGPVTGGFPGDGTLSVIENTDLPCSSGYQIFRREVTCSIGPDGRAMCRSIQPHSGSSSDVIMRRAQTEGDL